MNLEGVYYSYSCRDEDAIFDRWSSIIRDKTSIQNIDIVKDVTLFLERYSHIQEFIKNQYSPIFSMNKLPNDFIEIGDALKILSDKYQQFISDDNMSKIAITEKYFNILTGEEGLLLQNGARIEKGKIINNCQIYDDTIQRLRKEINREIKIILNPDMRIRLERIRKIEKINSI